MLEVLYKKAHGYTVEETTKEYGVDNEGNVKLVKEKIQTKYIPPDLSALKTYLEYKDKDLYEMNEQELKEEKQRLLKELKKNDVGEKHEKRQGKRTG